ncbi:hypothetical protein CJF42_06355 [Pseudoalteromonas sp. NBT06-2]|uniref:phosphotransferase n=1 Tax=Pseudoalteromonas sp. NBT06-2 TaxID=2025950 RepID=UPI000BA7535C|nr:phosphotransferase [Pseudoalteromonas sp. NBT06-2]PAJ75266.1 hypothetical protein CJF42_06355 [Pseudoalteromonas sp. NBT06-2]
MLLSELTFSTLKDRFGAQIQIGQVELIQSLWSDFGQLLRVELLDALMKSVIVKCIKVPTEISHPKGWHSDLSTQRKLKSYQVESTWYQEYSKLCATKVAKSYVSKTLNHETVIILEDLACCHFLPLKYDVSSKQIKQCLNWLAHFHAQHLQVNPKNLWQIGSYWHLATRVEELAAMNDSDLKAQAHNINTLLNKCEYQTIIHGDAKLANFLFNNEGAAAVDFQYVGGGVGIKDVMLLLSSMPQTLMKNETVYLDFYFAKLAKYLSRYHDYIDALDVCKQWRSLYKFAWADFVRFLKGWSPNHFKLNQHSLAITELALIELNSDISNN